MTKKRQVTPSAPVVASALPDDGFRPSRIRLWDRSRDRPLAGLFGAPEADVAAALLVRSCTRGGDAFVAKHPRQVAKAMRADVVEGLEPWITMWRTPYTPEPDFGRLVANGYAEFIRPEDGSPVRFTREGLSKLREVYDPCRVP